MSLIFPIRVKKTRLIRIKLQGDNHSVENLVIIDFDRQTKLSKYRVLLTYPLRFRWSTTEAEAFSGRHLLSRNA